MKIVKSTCHCGHDFEDHVRGGIEKIEHGWYWHKIAEWREECKVCKCHKFSKKRGIFDRFWNSNE